MPLSNRAPRIRLWFPCPHTVYPLNFINGDFSSISLSPLALSLSLFLSFPTPHSQNLTQADIWHMAANSVLNSWQLSGLCLDFTHRDVLLSIIVEAVVLSLSTCNSSSMLTRQCVTTNSHSPLQHSLPLLELEVLVKYPCHKPLFLSLPYIIGLHCLLQYVHISIYIVE